MPSPSITSPQVAINDIGSAEDFLAAIDKTIKYFNDGDIVEGTIVKVDRDEVLLDIGYKTEGVIPSRELSIKQTQSEVRSEVPNQLQKGASRECVVASIGNFGAFVDLGGVDGLVHVSELSWKHIDHPTEVVTVGDEVTVEVLDVDMDRERVSLSLKATQEDPWQHFARTHQIGQIVPGKVTKLVPFGSFVRVAEGIEGLVHISELAERHVEIPEQVVQVNDDVMVKIIDIDLGRRRTSLSLKHADETATAAEAEEFDPTLYGMSASYDEQGNYIYPEGFDPDTGEWLEGFEEQRKLWEDQYAKAHARWEAHVKQQAEAKQAEVEAGEATSYSSGGDAPESGQDDGGSLASDEALQALREKLTGGQ